jgi:hypothetical protein
MPIFICSLNIMDLHAKRKRTNCKRKTYVYFLVLQITENNSHIGCIEKIIKNGVKKMKKAMLAAVVAFAMVGGVYAADAVKADAKCPVANKEAAVCAACAKLAKDAKTGEQAKLCDACAKKCEAAKKAAK